MKSYRSYVKKFEIIEFPYFSDERGETIPFELDDSFPFLVKRVYVITASHNTMRGGHAHQTEQELFVCVSGSIQAQINDGTGDQTIVLDHKNKGLFVGPKCWHEFWDFSPDGVLLAFSSTHYQGRTEYIENKEVFLNL
jgi:dTDP-4-dehydrorhamnose 3,5-epimerase-like enzyme